MYLYMFASRDNITVLTFFSQVFSFVLRGPRFCLSGTRRLLQCTKHPVHSRLSVHTSETSNPTSYLFPNLRNRIIRSNRTLTAATRSVTKLLRLLQPTLRITFQTWTQTETVNTIICNNNFVHQEASSKISIINTSAGYRTKLCLDIITNRVDTTVLTTDPGICHNKILGIDKEACKTCSLGVLIWMLFEP